MSSLKKAHGYVTCKVEKVFGALLKRPLVEGCVWGRHGRGELVQRLGDLAGVRTPGGVDTGRPLPVDTAIVEGVGDRCPFATPV